MLLPTTLRLTRNTANTALVIHGGSSQHVRPQLLHIRDVMRHYYRLEDLVASSCKRFINPAEPNVTTIGLGVAKLAFTS